MDGAEEYQGIFARRTRFVEAPQKDGFIEVRKWRASLAVQTYSSCMPLDRDACHRALEARDSRFDGVFFVGVTSTGIYCRPICPARTTLRRNRRFFSNAAAAERAGFRPCLRCRPELAPGLAQVDAVPRLVRMAASRIAAGALNGRHVDSLARDLGVTGRHLRRAMQRELGVSPIQLAQTHRLLHAKHLLTDTSLPMTTIAFASGFQSVRRFNALFRERYDLNPHALRGRGAPRVRAKDDTVRLKLSYRPPLDWSALLAFLAARATPGVEVVDGDKYARTVSIDGQVGVVRVSRPSPSQTRVLPVLFLDVSASLAPVLMQVTARVRHLFDLDAEPSRIDSHLTSGGLRRGAMRRGVRVPGAFDGFELAVRAILGQQVSVKGATTLMSRLTDTFGVPLETNVEGLNRLTATPASIANAGVAGIRSIGLPTARATTIHALATRVAGGLLSIEPDCDVRELTRRLTDISGIGPWTADYIAMRAMHWPDAFPAADLVLRRNAGNLTQAQMLRAAERWRPWRAYAAMHLWSGEGSGKREAGSGLTAKPQRST
jgi:AraC family transcriptional regulator of adaptative response / DNA-3-methyladenine glycosylase II